MRTSEISGTFSNTQGVSDNSAAGIIATATFLAPLMITSPDKGFPPLMIYFSKVFSHLSLVLIKGFVFFENGLQYS